ncbi:conserved exported hypothetical protein [uncultured Alphaproteobacteria bacterium]|uniref:Uncharacterized protein n=1 Tax=uncultured Alphaproteobacteria bacterium TaxID=91750 RepID=A0A212KHQ7_9PROT|nr:conserved exported hypothetical protein [uncultured Alphaproteobacteria bacterium]
MTLGRVLGWLLLGIAGLIAAAEGIVAVGTGAYDAIATGELWTLVTGHAPAFGLGGHAAWHDAVGQILLGWPAWTVIGLLGGSLVLACRPRRRRAEYREASMRFSSSPR